MLSLCMVCISITASFSGHNLRTQMQLMLASQLAVECPVSANCQ